MFVLYSRIEQRSVIKFLVAEKCKTCKIIDKCCQHQKGVTELHRDLMKKNLTRSQLPWYTQYRCKTFICISCLFVNKQKDRSCRCPWCNGYHRRNWTQRYEFKSWTRLIAFHVALIPLGKVCIQLFSLQLWVNSRTYWVLQPWWGN